MKKIFNLFLMLIIGLCITTNVYALKTTEVGDTVTAEGSYESTRFVAGNNVTDKSSVDGISFVAGNTINLLGTTGYGFYAGNNITISENIEKDLFVAGNKIVVTNDANIGRDAYIAGSTIDIETNIPRNLKVGGESVNIKGITISGNAYIYADKISLDENTVITGTLKYPEDSKITGLDTAKVELVKTVKSKTATTEDKTNRKIINTITNIVTSFVTMIVILLLVPKVKDKLNSINLKSQEVVKTMLLGISLLIVIPVASLITIFTGILTPLTLIILAIYFICLYLSSLFTCYIAGRQISKTAFKVDSIYLSLLIGIVSFKILKLIPGIGDIINVVFILYGLGIIFKYIVSIKK